jgi:hypothetical protein
MARRLSGSARGGQFRKRAQAVAKKPAVTRRLSPEEREAEEKRKNLLWLVNNTAKDLDTRAKIVATIVNLPPLELKSLINQAHELTPDEARSKALVVELLSFAQSCPEGDSELRYDPNHGFREVVLEVARSLVENREDIASKVPLPDRPVVAALIASAIVSPESAFDTFENLLQDLISSPEESSSPVTIGLLNGLDLLDSPRDSASPETLGMLLLRLEERLAQMPLGDDGKPADPETNRALKRGVYVLKEALAPGSGGASVPDPYAAVVEAPKPPPMRAPAVVARIVTGADDDESEAFAPRPYEEDDTPIRVPAASAPPRPAPKPAPKPAPPRGLTPAEAVKLMNVFDAKSDVGAIFDKVPWTRSYLKDAFVTQLIKKSREDDGAAILQKVLAYCIEAFTSDSRARYKKARALALELVPKFAEIKAEDPDSEEEAYAHAAKRELGRSQLETLDLMFDKKLGSLQERTERAQPFMDLIKNRKAALGGFLAGLKDRLSDKAAGFREPGIQTLVLQIGANKPKDLDPVDLQISMDIRNLINEAFERAAEGSLKFPSDRAKEYFIECGENVIDALTF